MAAETERKSDFNQAYQDAWTVWGSWQAFAKNDIRAITQNAWTAADIAYMKKVMPDREIMSFSVLRRLVRVISNFEKMNRLSVRYEPVEGSDALAAAQFTLCANDALARGPQHGYFIKSDCFEASLKTGMVLFNMGIDRSHNILFDCCRYNQFVLHPHFAKRDLSDCEYGILRKYISAAEAKMMFPGREADIDRLAAAGQVRRDDKFANYSPGSLYGKRLLALDEWTRRTAVRKRFWLDVREGYIRDQQGNRIEYRDTPMERMLLADNPYYDVVEDWHRTVEVTQYVEGEEFYHGVDPWGIGDFSFTPFICYFDPEEELFHHRIQSAVRGLKDAQRSFDRRTMANIRALECVIGPGVDVENGALIDPEQAFRSGSGVPRFLNEGALSEGRIRDRPAPNLPSSWLEMQAIFDKMPGRLLGLDEDGMFGVNQKDQLVLGVVGKMRMGLGMMGMFDFFDNASLAHQIIGAKLLRLIQQYPPDKVRRIVGGQVAPQFFNREFGQYDAIPCETVLTDSQRESMYQQLLTLKKMAAETGEQFPMTFAQIYQEYGPVALPGKFTAAMQRIDQQRQQSQQRMQQIQEATQKAVLDQLEVDTANEKVHIQERVANVANRAAQAQKAQLQAAEIQQQLRTTPTWEMLDRIIEMAKLEMQRQGQAKQLEAASSEQA